MSLKGQHASGGLHVIITDREGGTAIRTTFKPKEFEKRVSVVVGGSSYEGTLRLVPASGSSDLSIILDANMGVPAGPMTPVSDEPKTAVSPAQTPAVSEELKTTVSPVQPPAESTQPTPPPAVEGAVNEEPAQPTNPDVPPGGDTDATAPVSADVTNATPDTSSTGKGGRNRR